MKYFLLSLLVTCLYCNLFAQTDQYQYFNKNWKPVAKDSAYYYSIFESNGALYIRKDYVAQTKKLRMEGTFKDKEMKTRHGNTNWYYDNGALRDSVIYDNGKRTAAWYFYENGNKKATLVAVDGKVTEQKGWDENGKEIVGYIVDKPAEFPGGKDGWRKYLEKNLNAQIPAEARLPNGNYEVKVAFVVDEKGVVSDVHTLSYPPACAACAVEAIRAIQKGPDWVPAIQFGKPVIYKTTQSVTFQVSGL